jgi:hypothetical protein
MVLFLTSSATGLSPEDATDHGEKTGWEPTDVWGSSKVSAVWIDEGKLYCFFQPMNAGPSIVYPLYPDFIRPSLKPISYPLNPATEQELKERVKEVSLIQEEMTSIRAVRASEERAQLLKPYVLSDIYSARQLALKELGSSGLTAVATIRGIIDDPVFCRAGCGFNCGHGQGGRRLGCRGFQRAFAARAGVLESHRAVASVGMVESGHYTKCSVPLASGADPLSRCTGDGEATARPLEF